MKNNIHPNYKPTKITCACGNEIETGSVKGDIHIEVCSACHPFYTGSKSRMAEKGGRIDRFKKKYDIK